MRRRVFLLAVVSFLTPALAGAIGLTVSDPTPQIGELVVFEITGHTGSVEAHWDFGGAGCAPYTRTYVCEPLYFDCLASTYRYASSGSRTVTVIAYQPGTTTVIGSALVNLTVQESGNCTGCTFSLSPSSAQVGAAAGSGQFSVVTQSGCAWTVQSQAGWITVAGPSNRVGPGVVQYSYELNPYPSPRSGVIRAADLHFTLTQSGLMAGREPSP